MKITNQTVLQMDNLIVIVDDTGIKFVQGGSFSGYIQQIMIQREDLMKVVDFLNGKKIIDEVTKSKPPDSPFSRGGWNV